MLRAIHSMQNQVFTWSSSDNSRYSIDYNVITVLSGWSGVVMDVNFHCSLLDGTFFLLSFVLSAKSLKTTCLACFWQSRALGMIRSHVVSVLKSASSQVNYFYELTVYYLWIWMEKEKALWYALLFPSSGTGSNSEQWRQQSSCFRECRGICHLCPLQGSSKWGNHFLSAFLLF